MASLSPLKYISNLLHSPVNELCFLYISFRTLSMSWQIWITYVHYMAIWLYLYELANEQTYRQNRICKYILTLLRRNKKLFHWNLQEKCTVNQDLCIFKSIHKFKICLFLNILGDSSPCELWAPVPPSDYKNIIYCVFYKNIIKLWNIN